MVIGGHRVQANEKFWTNVQELSGTVHLYGLLTTLHSACQQFCRLPFFNIPYKINCLRKHSA